MALIDIPNAILAVLFAVVLCECGLIIYRLFLHPLASFPGPKHTAATHLAQLYYDLVKDGGHQFPNVYRKWHEQYGPIVRITPNELHIQDSEYYETMYSSARPVRKWKNFGFRFQNEHTGFGTIDPAVSTLLKGHNH